MTPSWEPTAHEDQVVVDPSATRTLATLLGADRLEVSPGAPLPPLWHWAALSRWPDPASLGPDGHPRRGGLMPPVDLPRRMFAGGTVRFHAPLLVGSTVTTRSIVTSVEEKQGRSGPLVLVGLATEVTDDAGRLAIVETQDIVYAHGRPPGAAAEARPVPAASQLMSRTADGQWELTTDPGLLLRFSAATSNPHRIHVDWPYATRTEGYPGLVVHGPLLAVAMAETVRRDRPGAGVTLVRHRGSAPLFCGDAARLTIQDGDASGELGAEVSTGTDATGDLAVHARLDLVVT